jgi:SET domain-containing protein
MGLFAKTDISVGTCICEYTGKRFYSDIPTFGPYIAKLSRNNYIDAKRSNCLGRYANHSCCPNARLQMVVKEVRKVGRKRGRNSTKEDIVTMDTLWIVADRTIVEGEEITFHYGEGYEDFFNDGICLCLKCL